MSDPVFRTIQSVFAEATPDAVVIEGVDTSELPGFHAFAKHCAAQSYTPPQCTESALAAYFALESGAKLDSGEPSAAAELAGFEAAGYSVQDFLSYWIAVNIPPAKNQGPLTEHEFGKLVDTVVTHENLLLGTSVRFTVSDFAHWYTNHMPKPPSYLDLVFNDTGPDQAPGEPNTSLHTLSTVTKKARDGNVIATIKAALQDHNRVLVVYGASHLQFERDELARLMGVPKKTKPF